MSQNKTLTPTTLASTPLAGLAALALAGALSVVSPTKADPYEDQVAQQIAAGALVLDSAGYELLSGDIKKIQGSHYRDHKIYLHSGVSYAIIGACDEDCSDVDLALFDENGNVVAKDVLRDDFPTVEVAPRWAGPFTLRVSMATCNAGLCTYGYGVFGK